MAIEDFFDHKCDIYHLSGTVQKRKYGLPDTQEYKYSTQPDIKNQPCHFSVKSGNVATVQKEPQRDLEAPLPNAM